MYQLDLIGKLSFLIIISISSISTIYLFKMYSRSKQSLTYVFFGLAFLVLGIASLLILLFDWAILQNPFVPAVSTFIPLCLASGLLYNIWPTKKYFKFYLGYALLIIPLILLTEFISSLANLKTMSIVSIHAPSGLLTIILPLYSIKYRSNSISAIIFSLGGFLMSFGGMLLAFVRIGRPFMGMTEDLILTVLPFLLLIFGLCIITGIYFPKKWITSNN